MYAAESVYSTCPVGSTSRRPTYDGTCGASVDSATCVKLVPSNSKNSVGGPHSQAFWLSTGPGAIRTLPSGSSAAGASAATNCSVTPAVLQAPALYVPVIVGKLGPLDQVPPTVS